MSRGEIGESVRIGISRDADRLLRFYLRGTPFVSGPKALNAMRLRRPACRPRAHGLLAAIYRKCGNVLQIFRIRAMTIGSGPFEGRRERSVAMRVGTAVVHATWKRRGGRFFYLHGVVTH